MSTHDWSWDYRYDTQELVPPAIIGFGHKMRVGKDTSIDAIKAEYGTKLDIVKYGFGDLVRVEIPNPVNPSMLPTAVYEFLKGNEATCPTNLTDQEYRAVLQFYGAFKRQQDDRYWVRQLEAKILADRPQVALISGIRMKNEVGWLRGRGGKYVKVERTNYEPDAKAATDITENDLNGVEPDAYLIAASGQITRLQEAAVDIFDELLKAYWPRLHGAL